MQGVVTKYCRNCEYYWQSSNRANETCDYMLATNKLRPCPAGDGCTVKKTGKKDRRAPLSVKP